MDFPPRHLIAAENPFAMGIESPAFIQTRIRLNQQGHAELAQLVEQRIRNA